MAENQFTSTIETLFKGMDQFVTTKTVVGEPVQVGETIIVPLIDVTCGMAAGAFAEGSKQKQKGGGGMSAKMSPSAVLVIQNDVGNKYSPTVIVAAITSRSTKAAIPTHVCIRRMRSGLKQDSTVLAEQIRTIDRDRLKEYIGHLDSGQMAGIEQAMVTSLGLGHLTGNMGQVFFPSYS